MSDSSVTILGSNSATAVYGRFPSGQVLTIGNRNILIDCGEGSQFRMDQYGVRKTKIDTILITHLHGDHVFGLPGLLTSYQLSGRKNKLRVIGPRPIQRYIDVNVGETGHFIDYPLEIIELDFEDFIKEPLLKIYENDFFTIEAFELEHRIPCAGYRITEKKKLLKVRKEFIAQYNPNVMEIKAIISGEDYVASDGSVINNEDCTLLPAAPRSYAYCSDTKFLPHLADLLQGTSTIYHESTYLQEMVSKAADRYHSTARQAAEIAKGAQVDQLILGHYSSRYSNIEAFREEAKEIFEQVELAIEGAIFRI